MPWPPPAAWPRRPTAIASTSPPAPGRHACTCPRWARTPARRSSGRRVRTGERRPAAHQPAAPVTSTPPTGGPRHPARGRPGHGRRHHPATGAASGGYRSVDQLMRRPGHRAGQARPAPAPRHRLSLGVATAWALALAVAAAVGGPAAERPRAAAAWPLAVVGAGAARPSPRAAGPRPGPAHRASWPTEPSPACTARAGGPGRGRRSTLLSDPEPAAGGLRADVRLGHRRVELEASGSTADALDRPARRRADRRAGPGGPRGGPRPVAGGAPHRGLGSRPIGSTRGVRRVRWRPSPTRLRRALTDGAASLGPTGRSLFTGLVLGRRPGPARHRSPTTSGVPASPTCWPCRARTWRSSWPLARRCWRLGALAAVAAPRARPGVVGCSPCSPGSSHPCAGRGHGRRRRRRRRRSAGRSPASGSWRWPSPLLARRRPAAGAVGRASSSRWRPRWHHGRSRRGSAAALPGPAWLAEPLGVTLAAQAGRRPAAARRLRGPPRGLAAGQPAGRPRGGP